MSTISTKNVILSFELELLVGDLNLMNISLISNWSCEWRARRSLHGSIVISSGIWWLRKASVIDLISFDFKVLRLRLLGQVRFFSDWRGPVQTDATLAHLTLNYLPQWEELAKLLSNLQWFVCDGALTHTQPAPPEYHLSWAPLQLS